MSSVTDSEVAFDQGAAEVVPLPESRSSSPENEDAVKSPNSSSEMGLKKTLDEVDSRLLQSGSPEDESSILVLDSDSTTKAAMQDTDSPTVKDELVKDDDEQDQSIAGDDERSTGISGSKDIKCVDQFDTSNSGDVVRHYFTSVTRKRALSPVQEDHTYQLAVNSDLWIKVKNKDGLHYVFEVDSAALAAHSPVFSAMAYVTHTRGNQEEWTWELEQDSISGLAVMLSLLHLDTRGRMFNKHPNALEVYDILRVFDQYQVPQAAFYAWLKMWTEAFRLDIEGTTLSNAERLYTAYKLGDFKSLKSCIRGVAHEIELLPDGSIHLADGRPIQAALPDTADLIDNVLAVRSADLQSLLLPFQRALDFFMDVENADGDQFCKSVDAQGPCNQKMLGSLLQGLVRYKLYPVPAVDSYVNNIRTLAKDISQMDVHGLILPGLAPHKQRHGNCKLGQDAVATRIMSNEAHLPLSEQLVEHMYRAARDLGVHKIEQSEFHDYKNMFIKWRETDDSWLLQDDSGIFDVCEDVSPSPRNVS